MKRIVSILFAIISCSLIAYSQPATTLVKVIVAPDHSDWIYKSGEPVRFNVSILKDGNTMKNVTVKYQVGPEKMEPLKKDSLVLANDFLTSLPQYDGSNLGVTGGSQGGALSIITAALDSRVKFLIAYYPAMSDMTGYLHGRAGGWPHLLNKDNLIYNSSKEKIETIGYYDVVNFARLIKIPGMYSWGYNDETCPPTSMYASYNVIDAPKTLFLAQETGHWTYPEQNEKLNNWMVEKLKGK